MQESNQYLKTILLLFGILFSTFAIAQTKKTVSLTNGDGWYRIISGTTSQGGGMVRISGISGSNRQTNLTMNVSLMRFGQGGSINILDNVFYNLNHIVKVRGGSVGGQQFVVDIQVADANTPTAITIEVDNATLPILDSPVFNPTAPDGNVIEISGRVIGIESKRWPVYLGTEVGIGTDNPTNGLLHIANSETLGDWGSIDITKAGLRVQDNSANMYIDGNTIYTDALMNIGTMGNSDLTFGTNNTKRMTIKNNGNIGVGTDDPNGNLELHGTSQRLIFSTTQVQQEESARIEFWEELTNISNSQNAHFAIQYDGNADQLRFKGKKSGTSLDQDLMVIKRSGSVGIGTLETFGYKLAVNGKIGANEVKVEVSSAWPDYVFTPAYNLQSLEEVETFINENGHLPNIPSAAEVEEENGIELGEMNAKLLEKVEELTLHLIEKDKQLKTQDSKLETLEQVLEVLQNQNTELLKRIENIESSVDK